MFKELTKIKVNEDFAISVEKLVKTAFDFQFLIRISKIFVL
jgi:hypothetical protein